MLLWLLLVSCCLVVRCANVLMSCDADADALLRGLFMSFSWIQNHDLARALCRSFQCEKKTGETKMQKTRFWTFNACAVRYFRSGNNFGNFDGGRVFVDVSVLF